LPFSRKRVRALSALGALTVAAALAGPALSAPAQAATTQYTLTIFRDPAQAQNTAFFGINANGDIFGTADESGAETQEAFLLKAGSTTMQFLGSPGDPADAHSAARPAGINTADDISGSSQSTANSVTTPVEWPDSSTPTSLSSLPAIAALSNPVATGINDSNLIIGDGSNGHGDKPFTIQGSTVTMLPLLPNGGVDGLPAAVNDAGQIVGQADTTSSDPVAVEWQNGAITRLGTLPGGLISDALAINSSSEAVGASLTSADNDADAVLFAHGTVTDLNAPGSGGPDADAQANAINNSGVIVGNAGNGDAFIYQNGQATDLNTLITPGTGFTLITADGINNNGDIAGTAVSSARNATFGYELTPVSG
jgi:probable HAF family extracellular repeat protein